MSQCFCGCGRIIWLRGRLANDYGRTALLLSSQLEALGTLDAEDPDVLAFKQVGREWGDTYARAAHGELPLRYIDRVEWVRWHDAAVTAIRDGETAALDRG